MMRRRDMRDETQRQVEAAMIGRQAGQAAARDGDPVISACTRDELLLLRPPDRIVVEPHELDDAVVGLRPRIGEEDAVQTQGDIFTSRSASSIAGSDDLPEKEW